ncbi:hypothetical protein CK203_023554 [Vitis vinifera]|uniref:Uncharacterized protein n=1 Tax=Vitis vinifera TaxID=29760 RepID=A0A438JBZ1_VITVI|nr:hypothetical protein CK203_023554 [Vitis vinifera]
MSQLTRSTPEGKGLVGGWLLLANKLRALGVSTLAVRNNFPTVPTSDKVGSSVKGLEKESAVDEETVFFSQLQWAWILVKASGKKWPGSLQVVAGNTSWELSLWWEASPWVSQVELSSWLQKRKWCDVRDESGGWWSCWQKTKDCKRCVGGRPALAPAAGSSMSGPRPKSGLPGRL